MKAVRLVAPGCPLELHDVPVPVPGPLDVLVRDYPEQYLQHIVAPAGTWLPSRPAWAALTRRPGAFANSEPMTCPGSLEVPIMKPGSTLPRIQAGAAVPPIIHW